MLQLWKARNKLMYENRTFTAREIILKSITDAKEWSNAQVNEGVDKHCVLDPSIPIIHTTANHPAFPPGTVVCKVDAAWNASTEGCGIGGIFSGANTCNLTNVSEAHSHVSSALMAEAIAIHRAIALAVYSNVRSLAVLSDSLSLIKLLKSGGTQPELFGIIFDIYHFVTSFEFISFDFISRKFNGEADALAKSALALSVMNSNVGE